MIDSSETTKILEKLEQLEDENLAVELLQEFNSATKEMGQLILNKDESLSHDKWKELCDKAKKRVDDVVRRIQEL
ncbi:MAG: hypothetical protein GY909_19110 [Oligoflexia bacterium]|nr:hypothetical protein [Oligoflexia bacterium]